MSHCTGKEVPVQRHHRNVREAPLTQGEDDLAAVVDLMVGEVEHPVAAGPDHGRAVVQGGVIDLGHHAAFVRLEEGDEPMGGLAEGCDQAIAVEPVLGSPAAVTHQIVHPAVDDPGEMDEPAASGTVLPGRDAVQEVVRDAHQQVDRPLADAQEVVEDLTVRGVNERSPWRKRRGPRWPPPDYAFYATTVSYWSAPEASAMASAMAPDSATAAPASLPPYGVADGGASHRT